MSLLGDAQIGLMGPTPSTPLPARQRTPLCCVFLAASMFFAAAVLALIVIVGGGGGGGGGVGVGGDGTELWINNSNAKPEILHRIRTKRRLGSTTRPTSAPAFEVFGAYINRCPDGKYRDDTGLPRARHCETGPTPKTDQRVGDVVIRDWKISPGFDVNNNTEFRLVDGTSIRFLTSALYFFEFHYVFRKTTNSCAVSVQRSLRGHARGLPRKCHVVFPVPRVSDEDGARPIYSTPCSLGFLEWMVSGEEMRVVDHNEQCGGDVRIGLKHARMSILRVG